MIILIVSSLLILIVIYSWLNLIIDAQCLSIRGPSPWPIIGNGHLFLGDSTNFLKTLEALLLKYNGVLRFYILSNRYLLLSDPKLIEALTSSTELLTKGRSYKFTQPWLGQGLVTSTGQRWKMHRKLLTPAFHFNILQNFLHVFLKNEKILVDRLRKFCNRSDIDLFPIIALYALDNVTESIMGVSINAQTDSESEYVKSTTDLSKILAYRMRNAFAAQDPIFNMMSIKKSFDEALKIVHKKSREVIETRRKELQNLNITSLNYVSDHGIKYKYAFMDLLLLAEYDGHKIDDESVREEVDTFMFEGHDTVTSSVVFCLYCISKHEEVQQKIVEEQIVIFGDDIKRDPTFAELHHMKYLDLVIKESLRLYPSVPLIERLITRNTELGGLPIPRDTSILIDIIHLHRSPKTYDNPLEFRPERFKNNVNNPFNWLAFSAGPRNCIGQKFALMEIKVTLSAILRNFKILPSQSEPILTADLVLRSCNGVQIQLESK